MCICVGVRVCVCIYIHKPSKSLLLLRCRFVLFQMPTDNVWSSSSSLFLVADTSASRTTTDARYWEIETRVRSRTTNGIQGENVNRKKKESYGNRERQQFYPFMKLLSFFLFPQMQKKKRSNYVI